MILTRSFCSKTRFHNLDDRVLNKYSLTRATAARGRASCCHHRNAVATKGIIGTAAAAMLLLMLPASALAATTPLPEEDTLSNIPQTLSGDCFSTDTTKDCKKARIQHPKSRKAESCTIKCVTTCIRGGAGSPGEGPLNARRPLVVFKQGFRSRQYCLVECSDICNLIKDSEDDGQ